MVDSTAPASNLKVVTLSLKDLKNSETTMDTLEDAFGPSSLGILIVKDLPVRFKSLRQQLLSYASYLANLPAEQLEILTSPSSNYLSGWSHGKEALKPGQYDTLKGSFYVNCAFYQGQDFAEEPHSLSKEFPQFTSPNLWPAEQSLPGFKKIFEDLCTLIIDTAILVARACDRYAITHIEGYEPGYLEHVVKTSLITKARLLHYFPPEPTLTRNRDALASEELLKDLDHDSWCATHIDHGCLTGLTSPMYIDEAAHPPNITSHGEAPPPLPSLHSAPSPETGLYIHARDSSIVKVSIPPDCLAFQTGEALQLITGGKFKAVPHFVRAKGAVKEGMRVARNTLAVFTQPGLEDVVDQKTGTTFGAFSREVSQRFK
ncbi:MAG: hypothetical protein Q9217_000160 [Psora testacea]